jgi:endonuclease/exonuclease/phosphatase family metal-dependent hydrolase
MTNRARILIAAAAVATVWVCRGGSHAAREVRVATFNIEEFPKDQRQVDGAFELIAGVHPDALAVQEVLDATAFADAARARLGARWRFATLDGARGLGALYDGDRYELASIALHDDTRVGGRGKPSLEVALAPRGGGELLRLLIVHLQSGSEARPLRARQLAALAPLAAGLRREPGTLVVLGDFNATAEDDRVDLAALARDDDLTWATEGLACTAFWRRADDCPTSRLDHVLAGVVPARVEVAGPCAESCAARAACPAYRDPVSDHCPVVITVAR